MCTECVLRYIAPLLTGVSIFCLARRDSAWVTRIFGGAAGNEGPVALDVVVRYRSY